MQIRLLGTGAADGIPGFYANNPVSKFARENGGKDLRTRAAALVDGSLKIDLPPDTLVQLQREGLDARDWTALLFTHSHEDHFCPSELQYALYPFTEMEQLPCTIFANSVICGLIRRRYPEWPLELVETRIFESYRHGNYSITPVEARHKDDEQCHNLLIQRDGKSLLYATDTGVWKDSTFDFLADYKLDALVLECTEGFYPTAYDGHLDIQECIDVVGRLRKQGTLGDHSRIITTHHASQGGARHCDLEAAFADFGIEPGFDGMVIEF